jgi:hypothetical protein
MGLGSVMEGAVVRMKGVVVGLLDAARAFVEIDEVPASNSRAKRCYVNHAARRGADVNADADVKGQICECMSASSGKIAGDRSLCSIVLYLRAPGFSDPLLYQSVWTGV